ncbi:MAG: hypothetical protein Q4P34_05940 [Tissierellia bacterium]|nr:hypothetical protein [Tissierellia bacterium]
MIIRIIGDEDIALKVSTFFAKQFNEENLLFIDCLCGKRRIPIFYDVQDEVIYDIYDYLNGDVDLYKAMVEVDDRLDIIASSYYEDKKSFDDEDIERLLKDSKEDYDILLFYGDNEISSWNLGDECKNIIVDEKIDPIGEKFFIVSDKEKLFRKVSESELKELNERYKIIAAFDSAMQIDEKSLAKAYQNFKQGDTIELKKGFLDKIKEVFHKND